VLRVEGLLSTNVKFADARRQVAALSGGAGGGQVCRDTLRAAIALEFALPGNTSFIVQPSLFTTFGWRESIVSSGSGGTTAGNEWNLLLVVYVERPFRFTRDRLRASVTIFPFLGAPGRHYEGAKTKVVVSYKFSRFITGRLIYTTYDGGGRNSTCGQYDKWDNLGWEISCDSEPPPGSEETTHDKTFCVFLGCSLASLLRYGRSKTFPTLCRFSTSR
jgi:hypothetical protein